MLNRRAAQILKMIAIEQAANRSVHYVLHSAHPYGCISKIALYFRYTPNIFVITVLYIFLFYTLSAYTAWNKCIMKGLHLSASIFHCLIIWHSFIKFVIGGSAWKIMKQIWFLCMPVSRNPYIISSPNWT
jgi:hypothetical protein